MVWEELKESLIFIELEAEHEQEIMEIMGGALINAGYAKKSFIRALVERENKFPTGLDIGGVGVAIPHTDADFVKKEGVAIASLKDPVTFLQMGTDTEEVKVKLVFMLTVLNPDERIEHLQRILSIIQDTNVLEQLLRAKKRADFIEILKTKENSL